MPILPNVISNPFDAYRIWYYSAPHYDFAVVLQMFEKEELRGSIKFMKEGKDIPENFEEDGKPQLHMSIHDFERIMGIFLHESPLFVQYAPNSKVGMIGTSENEPIGEMEPKE